MNKLDAGGNVREGENLDWDSLNQYLNENLESWSGLDDVLQFHGGHANLTYLLKSKAEAFVLRRPPFGKIAPGAHDMQREYKVLSKLYKHFPQAPRAYLYCDDSSIIGAPFVIMERKVGLVVRYKVPDVFKAFDNVEKSLTDALIDTQAQLHKIDYKRADLSDLGKSEAFLQRQVAGWKKRWSATYDESLAILDDLIQDLENDIPDSQNSSIVHNDYKFDNCQFSPEDPTQLTAVFDWDMATIGDPLFDFASSLVYWPDAFLEKQQAPALLQGDFPDKDYVKSRYFDLTSYDATYFKWYEAFAYWKTAVIALQLYSRYNRGESKDKRMEKFEFVAKAFSYKTADILKNS